MARKESPSCTYAVSPIVGDHEKKAKRLREMDRSLAPLPPEILRLLVLRMVAGTDGMWSNVMEEIQYYEIRKVADTTPIRVSPFASDTDDESDPEF